MRDSKAEFQFLDFTSPNRTPESQKHIPRTAVSKRRAIDCEPLSWSESVKFWGLVLMCVAMYGTAIAYAVSRS